MQQKLLDAVTETGKPVIVVIWSGRTYNLGGMENRIAAQVMAFFFGQDICNFWRIWAAFIHPETSKFWLLRLICATAHGTLLRFVILDDTSLNDISSKYRIDCPPPQMGPGAVSSAQEKRMPDQDRNDHAEWADLGRMLPAVGQSWRRVLGQRLSNEGLSDATALPILVLWRSRDSEMRQHELAPLLGLETSGVVRLLDTLSKRGLLRRVEDPSDRRARLLQLTDEGSALGKRADRIAHELREELLAGLSEKDLAITEYVLKTLSSILETYEEKQKAR